MASVKNIEGFKEYLITTTGLVWSNISNKYLKCSVSKEGYQKVVLHKNGDKHYFRLNRLVALNYIPNKESLSQVHHIDGCKTNNNVDNLQWISAKRHNLITHGGKRQTKEHVRKRAEGMKGKKTALGYRFTEAQKAKLRVPVINITTGIVYRSVTDAQKKTNTHQISSVCKGKRKTCGGYEWAYYKGDIS